jgi:hypothetical protein
LPDKGAFLHGVFRKTALSSWYFDGENVVECVLNVVVNTHFLAAETMPLF